MTDQYLIERQKQKLGLAAPKEEKPVKKISIMNVKRMAQQRLYRKIVKEMLEEDNRCEVKAPGCTGIAQGLQHKVKRSSKNLLNRKDLLRSCNHCNLWIEENPLQAIAMGVSETKFKPE